MTSDREFRGDVHRISPTIVAIYGVPAPPRRPLGLDSHKLQPLFLGLGGRHSGSSGQDGLQFALQRTVVAPGQELEGTEGS